MPTKKSKNKGKSTQKADPTLDNSEELKEESTETKEMMSASVVNSNDNKEKAANSLVTPEKKAEGGSASIQEGADEEVKEGGLNGQKAAVDGGNEDS